MAQDDDIIDVTPESVSEEPAAQTKPKRSGLTSLVLLLLVVLVAFGGGIYLSPDLRERLGLPELDDPEHLDAVARELNERPRMTLNYYSPAQKFEECVASIG